MMRYLEKLRYFLIKLLAGDIPVVLNMTIHRPAGFSGNLAYFPNPKAPGFFSYNKLLDKPGESILIPTRDEGLIAT